jgi:hypothetical protein
VREHRGIREREGGKGVWKNLVAHV